MAKFLSREKTFVVAAVLAAVLSGATLSCAPGGAPSDSRKVVIRYSDSFVDHIGDYRPAPNYTYLIMSLEIENHGYAEFSTNPSRFFVRVNQIVYEVAMVTFPDEIKTFTLSDGQQTSGKLAFEVPATVSSFGYEPGYSSFPERINVEFVKQGSGISPSAAS